MRIIKATRRALRGVFQYEGRAGRGEYWWFVLACVLVAALLIAVDIAVQGRDYRIGLADAFAVLTLPPLLSLGARRLHDTGRSGWWQLIALVPVFGALLLVVWLAEPGAQSGNRYGRKTPPLTRI